MAPAPLYITDLDGTLLRNDATLSEFTREGLARVLSAGVHFTVASARSVMSMQKIFGDLPLRLPIIEFNGSFISDLQTGRHRIINSLSRDITRDLYDLIVANDIVPFISTFDGREDCLYYFDIANEGMSWYYDDRRRAQDRRLRPARDVRACLSEDVVCFTLINRKETLENIARELSTRFPGALELSLAGHQYSPKWHWLTVHDRRASKAQAIRTMVEMQGPSMEALTVFGDGVNDVPMFKVAARAVAVSNAIAELKKHAHEIIGSNEDDSVIKYILADLSMEGVEQT